MCFGLRLQKPPFFLKKKSQIVTCETASHFKAKNTHCLQSCYLTLAEDNWGLVSMAVEQGSSFVPYTRHTAVFAHGFVSPRNSPYFCQPLPQQLWADICLQRLYLLAWLFTPWRATKPRCCKVTTPETAAWGRAVLPRGGLFRPPERSWEPLSS